MFINIQMKMHLALSICLLLFLQTVLVKANELPEFELYSENSFFYTDEIEGVLFLDGEITNDMYGEFRRALVENNIHTLVIKAMRDSGNTWDQIAKHMNELSIPTARGGKWHGKTVLNAHQRLT
ncbi:hypothetical protein N9P26_03615 [Amylibacter sp.]|nr:hypothetical protein [Amylibacter sp.]